MDDYLVDVCDACLTASCWHGEFMCQENRTAGIVTMKASELRKINIEHPDHYSKDKLIEVCGEIRCT